MILGVLICLFASSCKPVSRDKLLESHIHKFLGLEKLVSYSSCRGADGWCSVYMKLRVTEAEYLKYVEKREYVASSGFPIVYDLKDSQGQIDKVWWPGPGSPDSQIYSKHLYFKNIKKTSNYPESYISCIFRDGYMYLNAFGFNQDIIQEFSN